MTQDDNLIGTLTVRETISYSARLRLPDKMPRSDKQALVESTIVSMGLQDCADTVIGNWHLRGISGGEKRRVSIALEILMRPRLLFLDEPTSGLDRFTIFLLISFCAVPCANYYNYEILLMLHDYKFNTIYLDFPSNWAPISRYTCLFMGSINFITSMPKYKALDLHLYNNICSN